MKMFGIESGVASGLSGESRGRARGQRFRRASATMFAAALLVSGCGDSEEVDTGGTDSPTRAAQAILNRQFVGDRVLDGTEPKPIVPGSQISISFDQDGNVSASAGCNQMGGEPDQDLLDDGRVVVASIMSTEMACDLELMEQETWLADLLTAGLDWSLDGDTLELSNESIEIVLVDQKVVQPDAELEETLWMLESLIDGESVSTSPGTVNASLRFLPDGKVEVSPGCNSGSGSWEMEADTITITDIGLTKMSCGGDADELEATMVGLLLSGGLEVELEGQSLTLTNEDGKGAGFTAATLDESLASTTTTGADS